MKRLTGVVNSFNIDPMKRRSKKLIGPKTNVKKHSDPLPLIKKAARKDTLFIKTHAFDEMAEVGSGTLSEEEFQRRGR